GSSPTGGAFDIIFVNPRLMLVRVNTDISTILCTLLPLSAISSPLNLQHQQSASIQDWLYSEIVEIKLVRFK
ncbi:hypothetical protein KAW04_04815, partial [Candidatus Bathyarchaeota archaeon]|nr:hypothetical protein [Candidatus Bathyarchaeota archaeon]